MSNRLSFYLLQKRKGQMSHRCVHTSQSQSLHKHEYIFQNLSFWLSQLQITLQLKTHLSYRWQSFI